MFLKPQNSGQVINLSRESVEVDGVHFSVVKRGTFTCVHIRNSASPFPVKLKADAETERSLPISTSKIAAAGTIIQIGGERYIIRD